MDDPSDPKDVYVRAHKRRRFRRTEFVTDDSYKHPMQQLELFD